MSEIRPPEHWFTSRLADCCSKPQYGFTASATNLPVGPRMLRITDIQNGAVEWNTVPYCECDAQTKETYRLQQGDLVVARIGATTGKAFLIRECPEAIFASYLIRLKPGPNLLPEFLDCFLKSTAYWKQIEKNKGGRLKGGINIPVLEKLRLAVPPLVEQRAIASTLRAAQEAKEARQRELVLERERKACLMQYLFTHGPSGSATKRTRFGLVPQAWDTTPLSECAYVQTGVAKGRRFGSAETIELPYLRVANVKDGTLDLTEIKTMPIKISEINRYSLIKGDVLMTEGGDFDKLGRGFIWSGQIEGCVHQNHIFAVRTNRKVLLAEYFAFLIQSSYGKAYFLSVAHRTTNLACINSTKLKAFPVIVPKLAEQKLIVEALNSVDRKIETLERESSLLGELSRAMLEELMTGQLSAVPLIQSEAAA